MNLYVYSQPSLKPQAQALIHRLGVEADSHVSSFPVVLRALPPRAHCLLVLSGSEPTELIQDILTRLGRGRRWCGKLVLYSEMPDLESVVEWARLLERHLPRRSYVCFMDNKVADVLKLRPIHAGQGLDASSIQAGEISALRSDLGLTQQQLAAAIGVSPRTVQNWEFGKHSPQIERRLRDLLELRQVLKEYLPPEQIQQWLTSPNDVFAGASPREWILGGRTRDVLIEFRRLQTGEPW
jgi:DNA-binding transcriptional regulator YiaG